MARSESEAALGDYLLLVRRRRGIVALGMVVGLLLGLAAYVVTPATYRSTTAVIVQPTGDDTNVEGGRTTSVINLDTEAQIVTSSVVASRAAVLLKSPLAPRELAKQVSVGVPANTSVLNISFSASQSRAAQRGAKAFAAAYLANRKAQAEDRLASQRKALTATIGSLNDQLEKVNAEIAAAPVPLRRQYLDTQRSLLIQQIQSRTKSLGPLTTADVVPGRVITDAQRPTSRSGLSGPLLLGSALLLGLLLGLALALLRDRMDHTVRSERDLERLGLDPLVGEFDLPALSRVLRFGQVHDEPMRQCRNALLARMSDHRGGLVIASVSPGTAGSTVAAAMSVTMARSGVRTAFVSANTTHDVVRSAFGVAHGATLVDALRGRTAATELLQPVSGTPDLAVLSAGSDGALYSEMLQDATLRPVLGGLGGLAEVIVLDVAPTSVNADAQTVVSATNGIVMVVVSGVTTTEEVSDAVAQMKHVGAPLLGVVLVRAGAESRSRTRRRESAPDEQVVEPADAWYRSRPAVAPVEPAPEPVETPGPFVALAELAAQGSEPVAELAAQGSGDTPVEAIPAVEPVETPVEPTWSRWTPAEDTTPARPSWSVLERGEETPAPVVLTSAGGRRRRTPDATMLDVDPLTAPLDEVVPAPEPQTRVWRQLG